MHQPHPPTRCSPKLVTSCRKSPVPLPRGQVKPTPWKKGSTASRGPWNTKRPPDSSCEGRVGGGGGAHGKGAHRGGCGSRPGGQAQMCHVPRAARRACMDGREDAQLSMHAQAQQPVRCRTMTSSKQSKVSGVGCSSDTSTVPCRRTAAAGPEISRVGGSAQRAARAGQPAVAMGLSCHGATWASDASDPRPPCPATHPQFSIPHVQGVADGAQAGADLKCGGGIQTSGDLRARRSSSRAGSPGRRWQGWRARQRRGVLCGAPADPVGLAGLPPRRLLPCRRSVACQWPQQQRRSCACATSSATAHLCCPVNCKTAAQTEPSHVRTSSANRTLEGPTSISPVVTRFFCPPLTPLHARRGQAARQAQACNRQAAHAGAGVMDRARHGSEPPTPPSAAAQACCGSAASSA